MILAWADGAVDESAINKAATSETERLDLRFLAVGHGAILEA